MNKIYKQFIDENIKTWKKFSTKLLIVVIILALIGALGLVKVMEYYDSKNSEDNYYIEVQDNWKESVESDIKSYKATLLNEDLDEESSLSIKNEIERLELALKYDINPYSRNNWKSEILNEIQSERANNNSEERIKKLEEILEKNNFKDYIEIKKQIEKENLDLKIITEEEYNDKIVILDLKGRNEIGKEEEKTYWRNMLIYEIEEAQQSLRTGLDTVTNKLLTVETKKEKEDTIKMNIYKIDHNIPPTSYTDNYRVMFETLGQGFVIAVIAISAIVIAGGEISTEVSTGTIKFWALTPNKRWKILTAKLLSVLFYIVVITLIMSILTVALGEIFFNSNGSEYVYVDNGEAKTIGNLAYMISSYFAKIISVVIFALFAIMLSVVTRNTAVAVSFSVATYMGNGIFMMIINQFVKKDWVKFVPFNNLNIAEKIFPYMDNPMSMATESFATSTSLWFSLAVLGVCAVLTLVTMYDSFNHRDII